VSGLAPRALRNCAPSTPSGVGARLLNFTVRGHMSAPADSVTRAALMPSRVRIALTLLWVALAVSVCTLVARTLSIGAGLGLLGFAAAALQAVVIYFIGRRRNGARIVLLVLFLLATAGLPLAWMAYAKGSFSALPSVVAYLLRGAALVLLFTGESRQWFRGPPAVQSGL